MSKMPRRAFISLILKISGNVNADIGVGTRVPLKKIITWNQEIRPFVSARAIRRCIRERLYEKGFNIDPMQMIGPSERQQLGDVGNPVEYIDDDLFGFLIPQEPPIRRSSPIKISHLISLKHTEIKVEFAARFPREFIPEHEKAYPAPFEVELAEWLGKLNVIISDRVGRFSEDELIEDVKKKLGEQLSLKKEEIVNRLTGFLEVLLWEGWTFARGAQSPSVPEFYYAVVGLTSKFAPMFGFIDIMEDGQLNLKLIENLKKLYIHVLDELIILNYRDSRYTRHIYAKQEEGGKKVQESIEDSSLDAKGIGRVISTICEYLVNEDRNT
jgi:CRISPR-associated protein Cst2